MKRPAYCIACATVVFSLLRVNAIAAVPCDTLSNLPLREATITAAHEVPAGSFTPPGSANPITNLPAFCRIALTVAPAISIEVWMPKTTWNERYRGEGGGGYAGSISYGGLANGIRAGYATASTDTGHVGGSGQFALNPDGTLNDQLIEDFASRSLLEMVRKEKELINVYYGTAPKSSYWNGCSTGGRQGLMAVQRFPEEYDGLVIAAPAINWDRFIPAELWPQIVMNQELGDPSTCLTPQEANAARKIWDGPTDKNGQRLWFGLERGASLAGLAGTNPFPIAATHMQYWVMQDP